MVNKTSILGVNVSVINYEIALYMMENWIKQKYKKYICVAAVHLIMECQKNRKLLDGVNRAGLVTPDGMPLVWLARLYGYKQVSRVYGPTLMEMVCALAAKNRFTLFLVGGPVGQSKRLKEKLESRFTGIKIVGAIDTPVRPIPQSENKKIIHSINRTRAAVVFVGLGCPHQEHWMINNRPKLNASVLIGVGAAFNFLSGTQKQAPLWVQNTGFEWLFRLLHEPERLWYRYTVINLEFLLRVSKQLSQDFLLQ